MQQVSHPRWLISVVLAGLASIGACGGESGQQSTAAGGSSGAGGAGVELEPRWECVGNVVWPLAPMNEIVANPSFREIRSGAVLEGLRVRGCLASDEFCTGPIAEGTTDAEGKVSLQLPAPGTGWAGYLEAVGPTIPDQLIPADKPIGYNFAPGYGVPDDGTLTTVLTLLGTQQLPGRGHLGIRARDCWDLPADGVAFEVVQADAESSLSYFAGALPDRDATMTDDEGLAVIVNVPAGLTKVHAKLAATGTLIGTVQVWVRDGSFTSFGFLPTP